MHPASEPPAASFSSHRRKDGTVVCRVSGQIDADSRTAVQGAFRLALDLARSDATIAVDLAGMSFCDSTGLNALLQLRTDAQAAQADVVLAGGGHQFLRLLEVTGADSLWTHYPTLDAAISAITPPAGEDDAERSL